MRPGGMEDAALAELAAKEKGGGGGNGAPGGADSFLLNLSSNMLIEGSWGLRVTWLANVLLADSTPKIGFKLIGTHPGRLFASDISIAMMAELDDRLQLFLRSNGFLARPPLPASRCSFPCKLCRLRTMRCYPVSVVPPRLILVSQRDS